MMKKLRVLGICLLMVSVLLAGCAQSQPSSESADTKPAFDIAVYDEILAEVKAVLSLSDEDVTPDGMDGIRELGAIYGEQALDLLCYQYRDVNDDGIDELLIGVSLDGNDGYLRNQIYLVYTVVNREPIRVLSGSYRSSYSLLSNNHFGHYGSAGAAYSIFGEFALAENGMLDCVCFYFTHETEENPEEIAVYYNTNGVFGTDLSEKTDLTLSDFEDLAEEMTLKTLPLEDTVAFSQLP